MEVEVLLVCCGCCLVIIVKFVYLDEGSCYVVGVGVKVIDNVIVVFC